MNLTPIITVVIPTYNQANFLEEAISSVFAQSYSNWEIIIINNYSNDNTIDVVNSFCDKRIKLINYSNNGIIAASRNQGIKLSKGKYIAFLDSDDIWLPEKLSECIKYLNNGFDLVSHSVEFFGHENFVYTCGPKKNATFNALIDNGSCIIPSATIVSKKSLIQAGLFTEDKKMITAEDYHLWIKLAHLGIRMNFLHSLLGRYRVHAHNSSNSVERHLNSTISVVDEFLLNPKYCEKSKVRIKKRYALAYYGAGRAFQKKGQFGKALKMYIKSLKLNFLYYKVYLAVLSFFVAY